MADNSADDIANLCAITGCQPSQAVTLLQNAGGDLTVAVNDFFLQMEGGGAAESVPDNGAAGDAAAAAMDAESDDEDAEDVEADDDDEFVDEDAGMLLGGYGGNNAASPAPPPSKRAKVEARKAPKEEGASDELKGQLQGVFALTKLPDDAADKLNRLVDDRVHSWAYGDERSLTYLLSCFGRVGGLFPAAAQQLANATGITEMAAAEVRARAPSPHPLTILTPAPATPLFS